MLKSAKYLLLGCSVALAASTAAMAGGAEPMPVNPFARTGHDVYAFGGYLFSHSLYSNDTVVGTGGTGVPYRAQDVAPNNFSGLEIGLGKELSRHMALQVAYFHGFKKGRSSTVAGTPGTNHLSFMGMAVDGVYTFNPDCRFQVAGKLGVSVLDVHSETTGYGTGGTAANPAVADVTHVVPTVGLQGEYRITGRYSVLAAAKYAFQSYQARTVQPSPEGNFSFLVGMSYYLHK